MKTKNTMKEMKIFAYILMIGFGIPLAFWIARQKQSAASIVKSSLENASCTQVAMFQPLEGFSGDGAIRSIVATGENTLFVATDEGVQRSLNNGESWHPVLTRRCQNLTKAGRGLFVFRDVNAGRLPMSSNELHVSWNSGMSWNALPLASTYEQRAYAVDAYNGYIYLASRSGNRSFLMRYAYSDLSYREILPPPPVAYVDYMLVDQNGSLFIADRTALFRSDTFGQSWEKVENGLLTNSWFELKGFLGNANSMAVTYNGQLNLSHDGGATWRALTPFKDACDSSYSYVLIKQVCEDGSVVGWSQDKRAVMVFHPEKEEAAILQLSAKPLPGHRVTAVYVDKKAGRVYVGINRIIPKTSRMLPGPFSYDEEAFFLDQGRILTADLPSQEQSHVK